MSSDDPQQPLAVLLVEHVVQGRADGRLLAGRAFGQDELAVFHFQGMGLGIEGVGLDLEIAAQLAEGGHGVFERGQQRLPAGLVVQASRTIMLRDWSINSTNVAFSLWVSV